MSQAEVDALVRPTSESIDTVLAWLNADSFKSVVRKDGEERLVRQQLLTIKRGIAGGTKSGSSTSTHSSTSIGDWISVTMPLHAVERLLQTTYNYYEHKSTGHRVLRTTASFSVPQEVADSIDFVAPTNRFPGVSALQAVTDSVARAAKGMNDAKGMDDDDRPDPPPMTPSLLRSAYGVGAARGGGKGGWGVAAERALDTVGGGRGGGVHTVLGDGGGGQHPHCAADVTKRHHLHHSSRTTAAAGPSLSGGQAVVSFLNGHYSPDDLANFFVNYSPADLERQPVERGSRRREGTSCGGSSHSHP
jgi:hypothetical protein